MSELRSGIIFKDKIVLCDKNENHTELLKKLGIEENCLNELTIYVKAEFKANIGLNKRYDWRSLDDFTFIIKQKYLPKWFEKNREKYKNKFIEKVKEWADQYMILNKKFDIYDSQNNNNDYYYLHNCNINVYIYSHNTVFDRTNIVDTVIIPKEIKEIPDHAFENCQMNTIVFLGNIKKIGLFSFYGCRNLNRIIIPETVELIDNYAFSNCRKLDFIKIPKNVKLNQAVFDSCENLTSIDLSQIKLNEIASLMFYSCVNLEEIKLPNTINKIGKWAFVNCKKLNTIYIPKAVKTIEEACFYDCKNLKNIFYEGNKEDWENIVVEFNNEDLLNSNLIFNL